MSDLGEPIQGTVEMRTVYRVRVAHVHTLKDGWRTSETTIEATGTDIDRLEVQRMLKEAYDMGTEEARRRHLVEHEHNRGVVNPTGGR